MCENETTSFVAAVGFPTTVERVS